MAKWLAKRLGQLVLVGLLASFLIFLAIQLIPGDAAELRLGPDATPQAVAAARAQLGLDHPWWQQYPTWLGHMATGNLGDSYVSGAPVSQLIGSRAIATLTLASAALLIAFVVGVPAGILAAARVGRLADWIVSFTSSVLISVPSFWLGVLGIAYFAIYLGWVPAGGYRPLSLSDPESLRTLVLPAAILSLDSAANLARFTRTAMLETLGSDYVRTARAKGVPPRSIYLRHAFRNALVPIVTISGVLVAQLLSGAVVIEIIFAWPGLGRLVVSSVEQRDYAILQPLLLLSVLTFLLVNLLVDVLYSVIDPRITR